MVLTIARQTGWSEERILWMPLKQALQYLHAAWVSEGISTEWRVLAANERNEAQELYNRLHYLTRKPTRPAHG